ncbi:unnamed protein product [Orchesella dallaii]|uniref:Bumetanide-sensitive sodium-(Potassium)-chloride cotransporter n=1 Tax=Orchesella dallaii TaxID=48710 RepID=A0ABP1R774_9HEXA
MTDANNSDSRFRVNRISSSQLHGAPPIAGSNFGGEVIPEDGTLEINNVMNKMGDGGGSPAEIIPNQFMQPRRSSLAQGLGGGRKKSVTLPKEFDYINELEDQHATVYGKNFAYYTREALPRMDNYKNLASVANASRPTLDELRSEAMYAKKLNAPEEEVVSGAVKFGWIEGVLVRCLLNIWGVMLFLRLSWVVAQAGIGLAIVIICLSATVTTLTALSMSAISTNGLVKGGGIYFMISRTLGPEFGGAVGAIFSFANATAVAMHTVGFAESLNDLLKVLQVKIVDNAQNDIRVVGTIALIVMQAIIIIGTEWESKAQIVLLIILLVAILDFLIGAFIGPLDSDEFTRGYVGFNATVFATNFVPNFRESDGTKHGFFTIFSIFFPAATGITAGANISGDLKDPSDAIPKGTLIAILTTTVSYIVFALLAGAETLRDATGPIMDDLNLTDESAASWEFAQNCSQIGAEKCVWGSHNSFQIMELMSIFGPIIYAGCFAATLSSALACLVSAPKIFQALCNDNLYPGIGIFGKGFRKNNDPFFAYVVAFIIALAFILIAELNAIAPLISNFYMAAYAMVNFCTFHAALVKPLGWRPDFKYYSLYSSFIGFVLCLAIMFLMSWVTALITLGILACLFFGLVYIKPDVNWGSSAQAQNYKTALTTVQSLNNTPEHIKNYRPQILVLSGRPSSRPTLLDLGYLITKNVSILICGHIIQERQSFKVREYLVSKGNNWLVNHKVKGFYSLVDDVDFEEGARCLMQASGIGKLKPNLVLMGYKSDWTSCDLEDLKAYFRVIHDVLDNHLGLCISRVREGFDYSNVIEEESEETVENLTRSDSSMSFSTCDPTPPGTPRIGEINDTFTMVPEGNGDDKKKSKKVKKEPGTEFKGIGGVPLPKSVLNNLSQFRTKQRKSTIDIWWLYDDGGLTMLLPYIIHSRSNFAGCKIRVFALANKQQDLEVEQSALASLLARFRIEYSDLIVITDVMAKAKESTREFFEGLIKDYKKTNDSIDDDEMKIDPLELKAMKEKTNRHLRLRELLLDHSRMANLVVMTLPIPRRNGMSAPLYMAWLECLTKDMPPFLLVRGNQESVLTYYS